MNVMTLKMYFQTSITNIKKMKKQNITNHKYKKIAIPKLFIASKTLLRSFPRNTTSVHNFQFYLSISYSRHPKISKNYN